MIRELSGDLGASSLAAAGVRFCDVEWAESKDIIKKFKVLIQNGAIRL